MTQSHPNWGRQQNFYGLHIQVMRHAWHQYKLETFCKKRTEKNNCN
jgi:hypothetical protein